MCSVDFLPKLWVDCRHHNSSMALCFMFAIKCGYFTIIFEVNTGCQQYLLYAMSVTTEMNKISPLHNFEKLKTFICMFLKCKKNKTRRISVAMCIADGLCLTVIVN